MKLSYFTVSAPEFAVNERHRERLIGQTSEVSILARLPEQLMHGFAFVHQHHWAIERRGDFFRVVDAQGVACLLEKSVKAEGVGIVPNGGVAL